MTTFEKLEAILACVQTDPGGRGLKELFCARPRDFHASCESLANHPKPCVAITTGFFIPTADPPANETDGPLGSLFLARALASLGYGSAIFTDSRLKEILRSAVERLGLSQYVTTLSVPPRDFPWPAWLAIDWNRVCERWSFTHLVSVETVGPSGKDGHSYSMRGLDISDNSPPLYHLFDDVVSERRNIATIGIGDGGNEIGMGSLPWYLVAKNIPNGDLIHCRVPTDHLIVAGVSNWGAYALAAGVYVLRNEKPPANLFDPDYERKILQVMVDAGPLVDGVTGRQEATVDGLSWDEYVKPLIRMREILER
jgi:D-glutamate cyclase